MGTLSVACQRRDPTLNALSLLLFAFLFSCGTLLSYMSTTHEPFSTRASRRRSRDNLLFENPGMRCGLVVAFRVRWAWLYNRRPAGDGLAYERSAGLSVL